MASVKQDKLWSDAVRKAVLEYEETTDEHGKVKKVRYLRLLADTLIKNALKGDNQALQEIGNRLDGKPHQTTETENTTRLVFETVTRAVIDADSQDHIEHTNGSGLPTVN